MLRGDRQPREVKGEKIMEIMKIITKTGSA